MLRLGCLTLLASILLCPMTAAGETSDPHWTDRPTHPFLAGQVSSWYKGLSSNKLEVRRQTLQAMLPVKKDIEVLFPRQAEKLWPVLTKVHEGMLGRVDTLAKDYTRTGQVALIECVNLRRDRARAEGSYKKIFAALPATVAVYEATTYNVLERAPTVTGAYLFVNEHWIFFPHLGGVVGILPKLE